MTIQSMREFSGQAPFFKTTKQHPNAWQIKKNTYLMWHNATCEFFWFAPLSSDRITLNQLLNGNKWNEGYLSAKRKVEKIQLNIGKRTCCNYQVAVGNISDIQHTQLQPDKYNILIDHCLIALYVLFRRLK